MKKMMRKEFDAARSSYWPKKGENVTGSELSVLVGLALLSDIHTMLEHITVEPNEPEKRATLPSRFRDCLLCYNLGKDECVCSGNSPSPAQWKKYTG